jgi:hypothetical protein
MIENTDTFDGVIGGRKLSKKYIREDVVEPNGSEPTSELDRKISRLMVLHPELVRFRHNNLNGLDELTKRALLEDMYDVLGVAPLRDE